MVADGYMKDDDDDCMCRWVVDDEVCSCSMVSYNCSALFSKEVTSDSAWVTLSVIHCTILSKVFSVFKVYFCIIGDADTDTDGVIITVD